jgi:hypothetical protein
VFKLQAELLVRRPDPWRDNLPERIFQRSRTAALAYLIERSLIRVPDRHQVPLKQDARL